MQGKMNWDAVGISTSVLCAIHCAVLPLLLSSLSIFGVDIVQNPVFEYGMIVLALFVGIIALSHGFRRHHRSWLPIGLFCLGILLLFAKQYWHSIHLWLLAPAVVAIISAHYTNYRLCQLPQRIDARGCAH
jgi:hypothetical protein